MIFLRYITRISVWLLIMLPLTFSLANTSFCDDMIDEEPIKESIFTDNSSSKENSIAPRADSYAAIVMDTVTGRVLYEKNAYVERPMASTTKIMTAILALEKGNLDDVVTASGRAAAVGGSVINLGKGEKIRLGQLLYGLMLSSGNDAAIAVAEHIGGTVENFGDMMTRKAKEIGANNTAYVTPHGLDKPGHYTTAYDLALITRYALKNKKFSSIVGASSMTITSLDGYTRHLYTTNEMLGNFYGADGVKTGYTGKAGRCLVTSVTRNNWRIISVVLGSNSRYQRANDSSRILNYVYNNYSLKDLRKVYEIKTKVFIKKGRQSSIDVSIDEDTVFPLRKDELSQLQVRYDLPSYITAPVKKGTKLGSVIYSIGSVDIKKINLYASKDIEKKTVYDYASDVYGKWIDIMRYKFVYNL